MVVIAETSRLIIRSPKYSDWRDVWEVQNDKSTQKNFANSLYPYPKKRAVSFVRKYAYRWNQKKPDRLLFLIELKSEQKVIGGIMLVDINYDSATGETGYWLNKSYRGNSYVFEAKIAIIDYVFNKLKLRKIVSTVFVSNKVSIHIQEKLGYIREGCLRKHFRSLGKLHDAYIYGLLKSDWKKGSSKVKLSLREILKKKIKL